MNKSYKAIISAVASAGLGLAVASAYADPHGMGRATSAHGQGGMRHGMMAGTGPGAMGHATHGQGASRAAMNTEEHAAFREKMRNAATPEERQKLAEARRSEMQKRVHEHAATPPQQRGPRAGSGATTAPRMNEHAH